MAKKFRTGEGNIGRNLTPVEVDDNFRDCDAQHDEAMTAAANATSRIIICATEAAMLASGAKVGYEAKRTDNKSMYKLAALPATTLENWIFTGKYEVPSEGGAVDVIDNLESNETTKALSAKQGNRLKQILDSVIEDVNVNGGFLDYLNLNKLNTSDVVDTLDSDETNKALSAKQGLVLKGLIKTGIIQNVIYNEGFDLNEVVDSGDYWIDSSGANYPSDIPFLLSVRRFPSGSINQQIIDPNGVIYSRMYRFVDDSWLNWEQTTNSSIPSDNIFVPPLNNSLTNVLNELSGNIETQVSELSNTNITVNSIASSIGASNGIAPLNSDSKVDETYLPQSILGATKFKGIWAANSNTITSSDIDIDGGVMPTSSEANNGWYFIVIEDGATEIDGIDDWSIGDWIISLGNVWKKVDNTDSVSIVNGKTGAVVLNVDDIEETETKKYVSQEEKDNWNNKYTQGSTVDAAAKVATLGENAFSGTTLPLDFPIGLTYFSAADADFAGWPEGNCVTMNSGSNSVSQWFYARYSNFTLYRRNNPEVVDEWLSWVVMPDSNYTQTQIVNFFDNAIIQKFPVTLNNGRSLNFISSSPDILGLNELRTAGFYQADTLLGDEDDRIEAPVSVMVSANDGGFVSQILFDRNSNIFYRTTDTENDFTRPWIRINDFSNDPVAGSGGDLNAYTKTGTYYGNDISDFVNRPAELSEVSVGANTFHLKVITSPDELFISQELIGFDSSANRGYAFKRVYQDGFGWINWVGSSI